MATLGFQGNHKEIDNELRRGSIIFHYFSYCFTMSQGKIHWEMDKERTMGKYVEVIFMFPVDFHEIHTLTRKLVCFYSLF